MLTRQMEFNLPVRSRRRDASRRPLPPHQAQWWFAQMRRVVDLASGLAPKPGAETRPLCMTPAAESHHGG